MSYRIECIKVTDTATTLYAAITRANEINDEYQPLWGVQVRDADLEIVYDTEDDGCNHYDDDDDDDYDVCTPGDLLGCRFWN